jgi:hypothetical protein
VAAEITEIVRRPGSTEELVQEAEAVFPEVQAASQLTPAVRAGEFMGPVQQINGTDFYLRNPAALERTRDAVYSLTRGPDSIARLVRLFDSVVNQPGGSWPSAV